MGTVLGMTSVSTEVVLKSRFLRVEAGSGAATELSPSAVERGPGALPVASRRGLCPSVSAFDDEMDSVQWQGDG